MPSKNMLPKGKRRQTVKPLYRATRDAEPEQIEPPYEPEEAEISISGDTRTFTADASARGSRLDAYIAKALPEISRARVQLLIEKQQIKVDGKLAKASLKLNGGEQIEIEGEPRPEPLRAIPENIPLDIVYEDNDLAVVNKPAGMMVHAGAGATDDERNRGTLVNALLHHFEGHLSSLGGDVRPGIVHRLDKLTSGLIAVAKNDRAHRALAAMFQDHSIEKTYIALVHGRLRREEGTINLPIARDPVRRTRMTTRVRENWLTIESPGSPALRHPEQEEIQAPKNYEARDAVSHYRVLERLHTSIGDFTLVRVQIETGRTHQIRVHMQSLGHPVVGDTLYGAPGRLAGIDPPLERNFLHATQLRFEHPFTHEEMDLDAPLPFELKELLSQLRAMQSD